MKIHVIIASTGIVLPELPTLINSILSQARAIAGIEARVIVASQYDDRAEDEFKRKTAGIGDGLLHVNTRERAGYFKKMNMGLELCKKSDVTVFTNDDIVIGTDFVRKLTAISLDRPVLYAPVVQDPAGRVQLSVYRKRYSKHSMFFRVYDEGLYTRLAKRMGMADTKPVNINEGRETVYGCCFILNEQSMNDLGGRLDDRIFLYYEEAYFSYLVKRFGWECKVIENLVITHVGGGTVSKRYTRARSAIDRDSALYVAQKYLGFNEAETSLLRCYKAFEIGMRQLAKVLQK